jgi:hypothetical protein
MLEADALVVCNDEWSVDVVPRRRSSMYPYIFTCLDMCRVGLGPRPSIHVTPDRMAHAIPIHRVYHVFDEPNRKA